MREIRLGAAAVVASLVLLAGCSDDGRDALANSSTTSTSDDDSTPASQRDLGEVAEVLPLRDEPTDGLAVDIEVLVRRQFADAVDVYRSFDESFREPQLILLDTNSSYGGYAEECDAPLEPGDAFYCPPNNTIYLDLGWLDDFSRRSVQDGLRDGAVFSTVAHELGHAWYVHVGFVDRTEAIVDEELFADCLAGAVIATTYADPDRSVPLIQQAAEDAYSVGSYDWQNPGFHGTPAQRRDATNLGAQRGFEACDAYVT